MKKTQKVLFIALLLLCALLLLSCNQSNETDGALTKDELLAYKAALVSPTDDTFVPWDGTAYWTDNGGVWHKDASCSYLAKAEPEEIHSGTEEDAVAAGKERVCSRCGK